MKEIIANPGLPFSSADFAIFTPLVEKDPGRTWRSQRVMTLLGLSANQTPAHEFLLKVAGKGHISLAGVAHLTPETLERVLPTAVASVLSPIGLLHIYRQYLFEGDTFLGPSVQHIWLSPGGSVEFADVRTTRSTVERSTTTTTDTSTTREDATSELTELAQKLATQSTTASRFGVSVSASSGFGVVSASTNATYGLDASNAQANEQMSKQSQQHSSKVTQTQRTTVQIELKTTTETSATTERRYVLSNTTDHLINYELSLKMRKVRLQAQYVGARLCWINHVPDPAALLTLARILVLDSRSDAMTAVGPRPSPPTRSRPTAGTLVLPEWLMATPDNKFEQGQTHQIDLTGRPELEQADIVAVHLADPTENAKVHFDFKPGSPIITVTRTSSDDGYGLWDVSVSYAPSATAQDKANDDEQAYESTLAQWQAAYEIAQRQAYVNAARDRAEAMSHVTPRSADVLREEERIAIMHAIMSDIQKPLGRPSAFLSEALAEVFDFDEVFYFVAPDWWMPRDLSRPSRFAQSLGDAPLATLGEASAWWGTAQPKATTPSGQSVDRACFISGDTAPLPVGASLGWLLQVDGDDQRNAFLNSPLVKVMIPIRPGLEAEAIQWLELIEGTDRAPDASDLRNLFDQLDSSGQAERVRSQVVYQEGYAPLGSNAVTVPREADGVFAEWVEVLPTTQVVPVEVSYL